MWWGTFFGHFRKQFPITSLRIGLKLALRSTEIKSSFVEKSGKMAIKFGLSDGTWSVHLADSRSEELGDAAIFLRDNAVLQGTKGRLGNKGQRSSVGRAADL